MYKLFNYATYWLEQIEGQGLCILFHLLSCFHQIYILTFKIVSKNHVFLIDFSFQRSNSSEQCSIFFRIIQCIFLIYDVKPVADGKKIPTRSVNDVAMSADTYMPKFSMAPWASTDCSPGFSKISPFCMQLPHMFSINKEQTLKPLATN